MHADAPPPCRHHSSSQDGCVEGICPATTESRLLTEASSCVYEQTVSGCSSVSEPFSSLGPLLPAREESVPTQRHLFCNLKQNNKTTPPPPIFDLLPCESCCSHVCFLGAVFWSSWYFKKETLGPILLVEHT